MFVPLFHEWTCPNLKIEESISDIWGLKDNVNHNITPILSKQWIGPSDGIVHFRYKGDEIMYLNTWNSLFLTFRDESFSS